LFVY
jgi:hypothetical protein